MDIDPRQAAAFRAVIETGSFEQAASRLHITASAVTQRIRALEMGFGMPLVLRSRPCRATTSGQRLLQYLRRVSMLQADLQTQLVSDQQSFISIVVAVNSDSLGTWFLPALSSILAGERLLFDLVIEDQDHTFGLLESGMAVGCVTTESAPMRGCIATPLGVMRYRLLASDAFSARWFPGGMNRSNARQAPVVAYSRRDTLQSSFLLKHFGLRDGAYPCHYVPGTSTHFSAVQNGLGYGMVPELLVSARPLEEQGLVDVAPNHPTDIELYWHAWEVQSPSMESLSARVIDAAGSLLRPVAR
ncbi:HTH-type transcriptional regulator ArgP [Burkholderia stagnalis]|uniref:ArgP/LysG family DNA-binding transcriptional regulator n=1 Tax=Burkholderia stagnalis TaxID=1503054 RepID=A0ABX9YCF6_9BURK|nr:HTH-type transcriptional regulator ArgP [Burkholderia stagnalis]RQQ45687.1 ArgP/LysG family DNA-binding transcriptional regulator [Burkholderia stagnalis]RQQ59039.1 ArgP/LysG family DNA-binding transcriptional regulator [Burkholderia stagnalis]RQQ59498.1 ArgP/LysG family DNA-binding transcriptional regulator [Burkholderia stagnalis]RQQ73871.1 ArgP/LysG family DNA-binding transcriptional regulator [Burkholderia stagnalis]RQQ78804.1 ArgP/LysG family DNA-binding transcriptional regulator [Burk